MTYCPETAHLRGQHFLTLIFGISTLFYLHQCINTYSKSSLKLILPIRAQSETIKWQKCCKNHGNSVQTIEKIERIFLRLVYAVAAKIINNCARPVIFLLLPEIKTTLWLLKNIQAKLQLLDPSIRCSTPMPSGKFKFIFLGDTSGYRPFFVAAAVL